METGLSEQEITLLDNQSLAERVSQAVQTELSKEAAPDAERLVYDAIIEQVELALFKTVMLQNRNNQSKAAKQLGISRGTMRTKLKKYFGDTYISIRD